MSILDSSEFSHFFRCFNRKTIILNINIEQNISMQKRHPILFILSGPSGVGKNTVGESLLHIVGNDRIERVITTTTRKPRDYEQHGVDYFFLTEQEFLFNIQNDEYLEYAIVHGNHYGSSRIKTLQILESWKDALLIIDVNGAEQILDNKQNFPYKIVSIFLNLSNLEELKQRIIGRSSENPTTLQKRLESARKESQKSYIYDHIINSTSRENDINAVLAIYNKEH